VVLCLSAVGEAFRERCRLFPGLVNCTTIDWFTEWPSEALYEVASRQMAAESLGSEEVKQAVCKVRPGYTTHVCLLQCHQPHQQWLSSQPLQPAIMSWNMPCMLTLSP
jgi:hypothetical protein